MMCCSEYSLYVMHHLSWRSEGKGERERAEVGQDGYILRYSNSQKCGTKHINLSSPYPCILCTHCAGAKENTTRFGTIHSFLCDAMLRLALVLFFLSKNSILAQGRRSKHSPVTLRRACCCWNLLVCRTGNETVILRMV